VRLAGVVTERMLRKLTGGWPGLNDLEFVDIEAGERISLQQFPSK
jgi:hypothetical protein